ncbi:MAG: hypothetical protein HDS68_07500 [Bacteroidales bacterium]|nr:hypothetical protein [Bacteroidales bacterium]
MKTIKNIIFALTAAAGTLLPAACHHVDNKRTPPAAVWIPFNTYADWETYGVHGAYTYRYFIPSEKLPQGFFYTAVMRAGYGGILLVDDAKGVPLAYDLSCPYENSPEVRVQIMEDERYEAVCPKCGSHYDVFQSYGAPLSGPAAKQGYGLTNYMVGNGSNGEYKVISR